MDGDETIRHLYQMMSLGLAEVPIQYFRRGRCPGRAKGFFLDTSSTLPYHCDFANSQHSMMDCSVESVFTRPLVKIMIVLRSFYRDAAYHYKLSHAHL